ncbi:MAG: ATP-binding protein, partial [Cyclobacteriaceae bacterium]|nr:ATP-binding protein [Cyclobacteriaceae bacterium]
MEYKFKVPCSKSKLGEIREFLQRVLSENSIPEVTVNTLVLAVDEVCANLIIHSHNCNPNDQLELKVRVNGKSEITFDIIDHGDGFNIGNYQEPSISDIVKQKRKGGIGLMLVRRIMDEIELIKGEKKNV